MVVAGIGMFFLSISSMSQGVSQLDSLIQVLHKTEKPSNKIQILNQLSNYYRDTDHERATNFAKQALFIAQSINNRLARAHTQYHLASLLNKKKDSHYAIELLISCQEEFDHEDDRIMLAKSKLLLGQLYKNSFQFEKSLQVMLEALDIFKILNLKSYQAQTLNSIGGNYFDQNELEKAFTYYNSSLQIYNQMNDLAGKGMLENNLGEIYRLNGNSDKALEHYRRAMKIHEKLGNKKFLSIILDNMGAAFLSKKMIDSSGITLKKSLRIADDIHLPDLISSANINLGKLYIELNKYDSARMCLQTGYNISKLAGSMIPLRNASEMLSIYYANKSDYKNALKYEYEYKGISDSLNSIHSQEEIAQLEMSLLFKHEQALRKLQIQRNNLKYFTLASAIISLVLILILLYGRLQIINRHSKLIALNLQIEREHLHEEIDYKNRQLATNVMYMVRKNELINLISEKLYRVKKNFNRTAEKKIQKSILNLQTNVDKDVWNVFQQRFQEVHKNFYKILSTQYPNLTQSDLRLCAFIKLNMSTKEIASITHQNPNTIDVNRTRLRRKLNLSNKEISLNNFLSNL